MKNNVSFFSNTSDNTHCFQACVAMILKYFLPNKEYSWSQIEQTTNYHKGLWTWPMAGMIHLKKMGFDVISMEDFDYEKFASFGEKYLYERVDKKVAKEQIKHSDILGEVNYAKEFIRLFSKQIQIPTNQDIHRLLSEGYLVICNVNGLKLRGLEGYEGHFILLFGYDEKNFYLHDPGLPPKKNLYVPFEIFSKAWAYPTQREKNLIAFKYS